MNNKYSLPQLPYDYASLEPFISEELLRIHHDKHHQAYVNAANQDLEKLEKARQEENELDFKAIAKNLSFNVDGHILHSLFWTNMAPSNQASQPEEELLKTIKNEFGTLDRFKMEFNKVAASVEGSGWATLIWDKLSQRPLICQVEKHNNHLLADQKILLVLDVWEHAYYLDYKNERPKFIEAFWSIVNWREISERFKNIKL